MKAPCAEVKVVYLDHVRRHDLDREVETGADRLVFNIVRDEAWF